MPSLTTTHIFDGTAEKVYNGIIQYEKYPEYIQTVTQCKILPAKSPEFACQVRYDIKLIKTIYYTLNMTHSPGKKVSWALDESNFLKVSNGHRV